MARFTSERIVRRILPDEGIEILVEAEVQGVQSVSGNAVYVGVRTCGRLIP